MAHLVDGWHQFAVPLKIHVIASVNGVFVGLLAKLQREQCVFAPGNVFFHVNLVLIVRQVRESFATDRKKVDLRPRRQMNEPQLGIAGSLGRAHQRVRRGP